MRRYRTHCESKRTYWELKAKTGRRQEKGEVGGKLTETKGV